MEKTFPKIHIIANCSNRKRVPPVTLLSSITETNIEKRVKHWWEKLNNTSDRSSIKTSLFSREDNQIRAVDLYIGSYWSIIRQLPDIAKFSNLAPQLWVISAGYGLISAFEYISSYSATFTHGNEDSVTNGETNVTKRSEILSRWWSVLSNYSLDGSAKPRSLNQLIRNNRDDYFLVVASSDYLSAVEQDLLDGIKFLTSFENLIIVTSKTFSNDSLAKHLIRSDARLQCNNQCLKVCKEHLIPQGVRGSISSYIAMRVIERVKRYGFKASRIQNYINQHIENSPKLIEHNRTRLDDLQINKFIIKELNNLPDASCTFLLRKLRINGLACEQRRFKELYRNVRRR